MIHEGREGHEDCFLRGAFNLRSLPGNGLMLGTKAGPA
jgi:hypothetical protein